MADSDQIAAPPPPQDGTPNAVMDEETRLRPDFVDKVLDAVDAGDDETARKLFALIERRQPVRSAP